MRCDNTLTRDQIPPVPDDESIGRVLAFPSPTQRKDETLRYVQDLIAQLVDILRSIDEERPAQMLEAVVDEIERESLSP